MGNSLSSAILPSPQDFNHQVQRRLSLAPGVQVNNREARIDVLPEGDVVNADEGDVLWDAQAVLERLKNEGLFFSISFTVTRRNFDVVTDMEFLETAVRDCTEEWTITDAHREQMKGLVASYRKRFPAVFIAVPLCPLLGYQSEEGPA